MAASVRSRLFLSHLAVLLIGMGLAAGLAWLAVQRTYVATQQENLLALAKGLAAGQPEAALPAAPPEPYSQVANMAPGIHTRVLDEQGGVLVSLPLAAGQPLLPAAEAGAQVSPQELLARPEIQSALGGQAAGAERRVGAGGGRRVLYAAAPVFDAAGAVSGIVYLATPLPPGGLPPGLFWQLAGALLAAVLLASLAGTLLARRLAWPLEGVAKAARAVSAGDLDQQIPAQSGLRELDQLGQSFNAMTASLRQFEQTRNAFLADVAHELRTPLTVIKGTLETLEDGAWDDQEGRGPLVKAMQAESERLIRLVNELLLLARADAGALQLRPAALDLGELARSRLRQFGPLAAQRNIELRIAIDNATSNLSGGLAEGSGRGQASSAEGAAGPAWEQASSALWVRGDVDRLAQVIDNLLDNAIRYTAPGSAVTIAARREGGRVVCAVTDQGRGIPPEHLAHVFERFYRGDASRARQTGGTGLGLAIARALVLAHGGQVGARNVPPDGAEVSFSLPAAG